MRPLEYHIDNCDELLTDFTRRQIQSKANDDAEKGDYRPPSPFIGFQYCQQAMLRGHEIIFYDHCFERRKSRLLRKSTANKSQP